MTSSSDDGLLGSQEPAIHHKPVGVVSRAAADEALELADLVGDATGRPLDDYQRLVLANALGIGPDNRWAAFEVADIQPRQNGKGDVIEMRELSGLFLFGEDLLVHTAHEFATANEAFLRLVGAIQSVPFLDEQVARIRYANGEQGVELKTGARLKYRARTGGAGRGFAGAALVVYDEAYALQAEHVAASLPTLSTHPNPQVWYASSAGLEHSTALWALRKRALSREGGRLAYTEATAEPVSLDDAGRVVTESVDVTDRRLWAAANPAYGRRITADYIQAELDAMGPDKFARERLGVWDPLAEDARQVKLPSGRWDATVTYSHVDVEPGTVTIAFDVSKDGEWSSIAIGAGAITDPYVEVTDHAKGVGWLPGRLVDLVQRWKPLAVGCNAAGPAGAQVAAVLEAFRSADIDVDMLRPMNASDYKSACGGLFTDVVEGRLRRPPDQGPLDVAARNAAERPLGDAWAWDVRTATVPISPLVAVTIARALLPTEVPATAPVFAY